MKVSSLFVVEHEHNDNFIKHLTQIIKISKCGKIRGRILTFKEKKQDKIYGKTLKGGERKNAIKNNR